MSMDFSFWERHHLFNKWDLTIVGAGFAGLSLALRVKELDPATSVLVLEKGKLSFGASVKNAGFFCFGSPSEVLNDIEKYGEEAAIRNVVERWEGLEKLSSCFPSEEIELERKGGHELFRDPEQWKRSKSELPYLNELLRTHIGQAPYRPLEDEELEGMGFKGFVGGSRIEGEGMLNPYALHRALMQAAQAKGVELFNGTKVKEVEDQQRGASLKLEGVDELLPTDQCVIACNGFSERILPNSGITPARGQVLITEPLGELPFEGSFHMESGNYYFRNVKDRVLIGGGRELAPEEERTFDTGSHREIQAELERILREQLLPDRSFEISERWSGIMGFTENKRPILSRTGTHTYLIGGFSGMGVALSFSASGSMAKKLRSEAC